MNKTLKAKTLKATFDLPVWQVVELRKRRLKTGEVGAATVRYALTAFFAVEGVGRARAEFDKIEKAQRKGGTK